MNTQDWNTALQQALKYAQPPPVREDRQCPTVVRTLHDLEQLYGDTAQTVAQTISALVLQVSATEQNSCAHFAFLRTAIKKLPDATWEAARAAFRDRLLDTGPYWDAATKNQLMLAHVDTGGRFSEEEWLSFSEVRSFHPVSWLTAGVLCGWHVDVVNEMGHLLPLMAPAQRTRLVRVATVHWVRHWGIGFEATLKMLEKKLGELVQGNKQSNSSGAELDRRSLEDLSMYLRQRLVPASYGSTL